MSNITQPDALDGNTEHNESSDTIEVLRRDPASGVLNKLRMPVETLIARATPAAHATDPAAHSTQIAAAVAGHDASAEAHGATATGRSVLTATSTAAAREALRVPSCIPPLTLQSFSWTSSNTGTGSAAYAPPSIYASSGATAGSRGALRNAANALGLAGSFNPQSWPAFVPHIVAFTFSRALMTGNGQFRLLFGRLNVAGAPATESCFGICCTNTGSAMRVTAVVRNGSNEYTATLGDLALTAAVHATRIRVVGDGTIYFSLNGAAEVLVSGAPGAGQNFAGQYFWLEAENGADASDQWISLFGLSITLT